MNQIHAILLMAYGGPDSLDDVEPYLLDVRGGRSTPHELVEEIRERYAAIGGKSPLLEITRRQAHALENFLNRANQGDYRVFVGMRHWKPYIREVIDEIAQQGFQRLTAICMTPFSSRMSTGAYYDQLQRAVDGYSLESAWRQSLNLRKIDAWYDHPGFVHAWVGNITETLEQVVKEKAEHPVVIFTAHSLPAAVTEQGDPYAEQFSHLCRMIARLARLNPANWRICYQSAGAQNTRWLGPTLDDTLQTLASEGKRTVLVAPVGFLCDHVEVLYDIDIEAQQTAAVAGISLTRTASMNDRPSFISALAEIIQMEVKSR